LIDPSDCDLSEENELYVLDKEYIRIFDYYGNYLRAIPLRTGIIWKSIHISKEGVAVTSTNEIHIYNPSTQSVKILHRRSLVGFSESEFRDAILTEKKIYILTPTAILVAQNLQ
jgi:hypothetical protein